MVELFWFRVLLLYYGKYSEMSKNIRKNNKTEFHKIK